MVLSYTQLRNSYAPACKDNANNFLEAFRALDACFKKWHYGPHAGSGCFNCRRVTGGSGYSMHAYPDFTSFNCWNGYHFAALALAADINPQQNPYGPRLVTDMPRGMIDDIYKIRTKNGQQVFQWGGYYSGNKDAMHFEIVCSKSSLATGIDLRTVPKAAPAPAPAPTPKPEEEDMTPIYVYFTDNRRDTNVTEAHCVKTLAKKPLVSGIHCYALCGNVATYQTKESKDIGMYLSGGKAPVIGSPADPVEIMERNAANAIIVNGWFASCSILDGPLKDIKE